MFDILVMEETGYTSATSGLLYPFTLGSFMFKYILKLSLN
jgi:hypothetical protein